MAKGYKRTSIGSVIKSNDAKKPNYMKFRLKDSQGNELVPGGKLTLEDGATLSVESKAFQLKSAQEANAAGKISAEILEKIVQRLEKQPDFVLGEIIHVTKGN